MSAEMQVQGNVCCTYKSTRLVQMLFEEIEVLSRAFQELVEGEIYFRYALLYLLMIGPTETLVSKMISLIVQACMI